MAAIFTRPGLAARMAGQLLDPGPLDENLRSGLFLSGIRRTGKTTFLKHDLIPALEQRGALVVYVDLWSDVAIEPAELLRASIRTTLADVQEPGSKLMARLRALGGVSLDVAGIGFSFDLEDVGLPDGVTLSEALTELVDRTGADVALIIDEVQQALSSKAGSDMLLALKAARDAINTRPDTPGHLLFIGTGSHRAYVAELTSRRSQAFAGAASVPYPLLGSDYVEHLHTRLVQSDVESLPSPPAMLAALERLGHRPEELLRALRLLTEHRGEGCDPDDVLAIVSNTLRAGAADIELHKLERSGPLAQQVFERIVEADGEARGLYARAALDDYTERLGRRITSTDVQQVLEELTAENLIMRAGHGRYAITDQFVQTVWAERAQRAQRTGAVLAAPGEID